MILLPRLSVGAGQSENFLEWTSEEAPVVFVWGKAREAIHPKIEKSWALRTHCHTVLDFLTAQDPR